MRGIRYRTAHDHADPVEGRRRRARPRFIAATAAAVAALTVPAAIVYACIGLVALEASPASVQPGGALSLRGMDFVPTAPVQIHLDSINGPVIATITQMTGGVMTSRFNQTITIPSNVSSGQHTLIATQNAHNMNGGNPARTVIYVGVAAPGPQGPEARPAAAQIDSGLGRGALALVALGAAVAGLLVFGFFVLRPSRPAPSQAGPA